jgi:hypothetical protein
MITRLQKTTRSLVDAGVLHNMRNAPTTVVSEEPSDPDRDTPIFNHHARDFTHTART